MPTSVWSKPSNALAGSVKEEDDGPGFLFGEIGPDKTW